MALHTRLHLKKGEHIVWQRRMALRSLWPFWLLGLATVWLYGVGMLFWLYAAVKWIRIRYLVTTQRVIRVEEHYAFLLRVEHSDLSLPDVTGMEVSRGRMGGLLGYTDVTVHGDGNAITMTGLASPSELRETLQPYL